MNLSEYILLPREKRIAHIDLSTPCTFIGSNTWIRGKDWDFHELQNDVGNLRGKIARCHLCGCGVTQMNNGTVCNNPLHYYWGTPKENTHDMPREHLQRGGFAMKGKLLGVPKSEEMKQKLRKPKPPQTTWECLVTHRVFHSLNWISRFQNKHGIDPSQRKQLS